MKIHFPAALSGGVCYVLCSEIRNFMSLLSASQDFSCNTLRAVPGLWGKLRYVASLKRPDGRYEHWGLARKHGEEEAQSAILEAHKELVLQILRTPMRELRDETTKEAYQCAAASPKDFVLDLMVNTNLLVESSPASTSARHFMSVLESLAALVPAYTDANPRAS